MLVLARQKNERICIDGSITVEVLSIGKGKVRLGIEAPKNVAVYRSEIQKLIDQKKEQGGDSNK